MLVRYPPSLLKKQEHKLITGYIHFFTKKKLQDVKATQTIITNGEFKKKKKKSSTYRTMIDDG